MTPEYLNRRLIDRYITAYNDRDVAGMLDLLDDDVVFENVANGQVTAAAHGIEEFRALAEHGVTLFSSRRQTVTRYVPEPDGAVVDVDFEAVLATDLGPDLRAGDTLRLSGRSTFRLRDGRIVHLVDES